MRAPGVAPPCIEGRANTETLSGTIVLLSFCCAQRRSRFDILAWEDSASMGRIHDWARLAAHAILLGLIAFAKSASHIIS